MAIIYSYPKIDEIQGSDLILVADASKQNKTKSASVSQLLLGQATVIQVDDRVVTGASFNTNDGILTLTRNSGDIPSVTTNLDGRYVQSLTTTGSSGAATLLNGVLNIPQYSGGGAVDSVNGQTGTVVLTTSNINNDSGYVTGTTISQTAITEIKTLTSAEYASETKLDNVMYVII